MATETMAMATTAWRQIPVGVKMSLGAREPAGSKAEGVLARLTFKVGSKPLHYVEVDLDPSDTYTVRMLKLKRKTYERVVLAEASDVYCDDLGRVLLGMEKHLA